METSWDSVAMSGGSAAIFPDGSKFGCFPAAYPFGAPPPPIPDSSGSGKKARASPGSNPPRCQVEGCELDLSNAKLYYSKHKVCPTHSKSPKVIIGGLQRRFCQQCSRFHLLSEFDQGKRSCRRRLAGHNKRRRKPPSGTFLHSYYGSNGGCGDVILDFTASSRTSVNNSWQISISKQHATATHHSTAPHQRLCDAGNPPPSHVLLQGSPTEVGFHSCANPPGECYAGGANFVHALSLLSSQPLGSGNKDAGMVSNALMNAEGQPMAPQKMPHAATVGPCSDTPWCVKAQGT